MRPQPVRSCFHDVDDFRVRLNCPSARSRRGNKYLGKINWIFAQCGRLYLWVAVRCAREAPLLAPAPYNVRQNYIQIILHDYLGKRFEKNSIVAHMLSI